MNEFLSIEEVAKKCTETKLIALSGRDDEVNTLCAVRLCNHLYNVGYDKIIYFSLKEEVSNFMMKYPYFPFEINDTAGLDIEELENIVRNMDKCSPMDVIVIDYLPLLSNKSIQATRQEEIESIVRRLKRLSEEIKVPILMLIPLLKYMPMDYPILQELSQYGHIKEILDVIAYIDSDEDEYLIKILKENK